MSWQYIAGFMDGEGNISKSWTIRKNKRSKDYVKINIGNTDKKVLEMIQSFIGYGKIYTRTKFTSPLTKKTQFNLLICRINDCKDFLEHIIPYLVIKLRDAIKALNYIKANPKVFGTKGCSGSKEQILAYKRKYYQEHKELWKKYYQTRKEKLLSLEN